MINMTDKQIFVKTYDELTKDELYEILKSRAEIFVVEQNCVYQDLDDIDYRSVHVFTKEKGTVEDRERITGYLRIFEKSGENNVVHMGRVMTLVHGMGLGGVLLKAGIQAAFEKMKASEIYIEAQVYATGYYEREGFQICSGEFLEDGIPHVQMRLNRISYDL